MSRIPDDHEPSESLVIRVYESFDWKWVSIGFLFVCAGNLLGYWLLRPLLEELLFRQQRVLAGAALAGGTGLLVYFLGGLLVGRMSPRRTLREPAVASLLSLVAVFVAQLYLGQVNLLGLILGAPFCFGVAYLGAWFGEKWQAGVQR